MARPAFVLLLLTALFGCLAIFNATLHEVKSSHLVWRQLVWLAVGVLVLILAARIRPETYRRYYLFPAGGLFLLLILVVIVGHSSNGMQGWFRVEIRPLTPIFSPILIQPSELAKPFYILTAVFMLCSLTRLHQKSLTQKSFTWRRAILYFCMCGSWLLLIALQPDFGTVLIYGSMAIIIYWLAGGLIQHLLSACGVAVLSATIAIFHYDYIRNRFIGFLSPEKYPQDAGWHVLQFQTALAHGGLAGADQPLWSQYYLPLGYSDSIFATVGERIGLIGLLAIILVVCGWFLYVMRVGRRLHNPTSQIIVTSLGVMLGLQAFVHISVNLGLLPPTGITFPLLSYGGSSLVGSFLTVGILLAHTNEKTVPQKETDN